MLHQLTQTSALSILWGSRPVAAVKMHHDVENLHSWMGKGEAVSLATFFGQMNAPL
jgi:hypothetical protein